MTLWRLFHGEKYERVFATRIKVGLFSTKFYNGDTIVAVAGLTTMFTKET